MDGYSRYNTESVAIPVLRFLRTLFSEPDEELFQFVIGKQTELRSIGVQIDDSLTLDQMQAEYTRLFLGPADHHPPYQSVFTEGTYWGVDANEVNQFMKQYGLSKVQTNTMPPDHAAMIFELLEKILKSDLPNKLTVYNDFMSKHTKWLLDFLLEIIGISRLQIYKSGFSFTRVFLKEELNSIP
ncbi:MAG: molecular chaperone TorD family protein [Candidatus Marinimicrobia bacterium]|nr:molecular chaperone TorD family protein [Candidatus Neomarinimicrobiota bacterium]